MRNTLLSGVAAFALAFGVTAASAQNASEPRRGDDQSQRTPADQAQRNQDQTQRNQSPQSTGQSTGQSQNTPSGPRGDQSSQQSGQNQQGAQAPQPTGRAQGGTQGQEQGTREPNPGQNQQGAQNPPQTGPAQGGTQGQSQQGTREPAPGQNQQGAQAPQQGQSQQAQTPQAQTPQGQTPQGQNQQGAQAPRQGNQDSQAAARESGQPDSRRPDSSGRIELGQQQRVRISSVIRQQKIEPVTNLNFAVSVGSAVPSSVRLVPLPRELADVVPEYRSYSFFVAQQEVVIVDPQSYRIVAFLPLSDSGTVGTASRDSTDSAAPPAPPPKTRATRPERKKVTTTEEKPSFTDRERPSAHRNVERRGSVETETDVTVGSSRPESGEIEELPPRARRMAPPVRRHFEPEDRGPRPGFPFSLFDIFR